MSVFAAVVGSVGNLDESERVTVEDESITADDPIEIYDRHDLNGTRNDLSADYVLMNDLDEDTDGYEDLVDTEEGWEPIGDYERNFTGTLDGNDHEISDLYINRSGLSGVGLIGYLGEEGVILDISVSEIDLSGINLGGIVGINYGGTIENSYATGKISGKQSNIGGLVGYNEGEINDCHADVKIDGYERLGDTFYARNVGGLVGQNEGTISNSSAAGDVIGKTVVGGLVGGTSGTVFDSYATGSVEGGWGVGGLIGKNTGKIERSYSSGEVSSEYPSTDGGGPAGGLVGSNNGTISNSYSTGDVSSYNWVGGLVGGHVGLIENCYAVGAVSGEDYVGGLIGKVGGEDRRDQELEGEVFNSYSVGEVSGDNDESVGGLVGLLKFGEVKDSYWDVDTSGQDESDGGTGLTTEEMTGADAEENMEGFDFEDIWETVEKQHENATEDGYPVLQIISREEQLQHVYPSETVNDSIPGFTTTLLLIASIIAVAIYRKKSKK